MTESGTATNADCYGAGSILTGNRFSNNSLWFDIDGNVVEPEQELDVYGTNLTIDWDLGFGELKSVTGYRTFEAKFNNDFDMSPHVVFQNLNTDYNQDQVSQEFQLTGSAFGNSVDWITGAYYFKEDAQQLINLLTSVATANNFPDAPLFLADDRNADNKSVAWFGQSTLHMLDERLHLTAGIRFTEDEKSFFTRTAVNPTVNAPNILKGSLETSEWTPLITLAYDVTDDVMAYGTYSEGFRNGGFPPRIIGAATEVGTFDPEFVEVWEAGLKSSLFGNRVRLNLAGFYTSYDDIQVAALRTDLPAGTGSIATDNLAGATLKGFELEANYLVTENLRLDYSLGYLDNEITEVVGGVLRSGPFTITRDSSLPYTPEVTSSLGASVHIPIANGGELFLRGDWIYVSSQYLGIENLDIQYQEAYHKVNVSGTYIFPGRSIEAQVGVRNLTDSKYSTTSALANDLGSAFSRTINRPRQVFITLTYRFGDD